MEKKVKYVYQLSLSDGKILLNEGDGIFSVSNPEKPDEKVLVNSAVLIKIIEEKPEEVQEEPQVVVAEEISEENVICVDEDCNDCK